MKLIDKIKLAKQLLKFEDIATEQGTITIDGDLEVGKEAFMNGEDGELQPAADGEYNYGEQVIVIAGGIITEIREKEVIIEEPVVEEPVVEEPMEEETVVVEEPVVEEPVVVEDDKDEKIKEQKATIEEQKATIEELKATIEELKAKLEEAEKPVDEPAEEEFKKNNKTEEVKVDFTKYIKRK